MYRGQWFDTMALLYLGIKQILPTNTNIIQKKMT